MHKFFALCDKYCKHITIGDAMEEINRPCDRCDAVNDFNSHILCREYQLTQGIVAWLCIECKKNWLSKIDNWPGMKEYDDALFKLEAWKSSVHNNYSEEFVDQGLQINREVLELEKAIYKIANSWLLDFKDDDYE